MQQAGLKPVQEAERRPRAVFVISYLLICYGLSQHPALLHPAITNAGLGHIKAGNRYIHSTGGIACLGILISVND